MIFNYNSLNENDLQQIYPNTSNLNIMDKLNRGEYISLYNLYRKIFTQYIIEKIGLKEYDDEISKSKLNFEPTKQEDMDLYQYFSANILKYLYIRNNIYIERLSEVEIRFLRQLCERGIKDLNEETVAFIEGSFPKVISEEVMGRGENFMVFFGPSRNFMANYDSLVIGMRYDEFYDSGLEDSEWGMQHDAQITDFLPELFYKIEANSANKLPISIAVFRYNQYSVRKREKKPKNNEYKGEEK